MHEGYKLESGSQVFAKGTGGAQQLLGTNMERESVFFGSNSSSAGGQVKLVFGDTKPATAGFWFELSAGTPNIVLHYHDIGPIIYQAVQVDFGLAGNTVMAIETFRAKP